MSLAKDLRLMVFQSSMMAMRNTYTAAIIDPVLDGAKSLYISKENQKYPEVQHLQKWLQGQGIKHRTLVNGVSYNLTKLY